MRAPTCLLACLAVAGCAGDPSTGDDTGGDDAPPPPPPTDPTPLARCADPALPMTQAWEVDNIRAPLTQLTRSGRTLVVSAGDGSVKTWELAEDGGTPSAGTPSYGTPFVDEGEVVGALAAAPAPAAAITGVDAQGRAHLWDMQGQAMRTPIQLVTRPHRFVAVDAELRWLAAGTGEFAGELSLTDLATGAPVGPLATEFWGVTSGVIGHDGRWVTVGDWYGCPAIELRDPRTPEAVTSYWDRCHSDGEPIASGSFRAVALDPEATTAITGGDEVLARFDLTASTPGPSELLPIDGTIEHLVWLHGDDLIVTLGPAADGASTIGFWSLAPFALRRTLTVPAAIGLAVDAEAGLVVTASDDGLVRAHGCGGS